MWCGVTGHSSGIDRPHEVEACKESDRAWDAEEPIRNHHHVSEVNQLGHCLGAIQLGVEAKYRVKEQIFEHRQLSQSATMLRSTTS